MARVVIGLPAYENAEFLPEALESLLAQTYRDLAIVVCDDSASEESQRIVGRFAERDPRIHYERNARRLGMVGNWRRTYERARELHPAAELFAWGSDHDAWHPRWLERLVPVLDGHPEVVLAYPMNIRIAADGTPLVTPWRFDTQGIVDVAERMSVAARGMVAGDMVYGLFRVDAQARAGIFRHVLLPDRLLLSELSIHGQFAQIPEILWFRRFTGAASLQRQRAAFFPEGAPLYSYLPWWLVHPAVLAYDLVLRGVGSPGVGRFEGASLAAQFVMVNLRLEGLRKVQRGHARLRTRIAPVQRLAGRVISFGARRGWRSTVAIQRAHHLVNERGGMAVLMRRQAPVRAEAPAPPS